MSVVLENLIDRAGKQAANARFVPGNAKPRHRRPVQDDASSTATESKAKLLERDEESKSADKVRQQSFKEILRTIWPNLTNSERGIMIAGFWGAAVHAAATPTFAYIFSKLLATYSIAENRTQKTLIYSMAMLGVAAIDGLSVYFFRYLLEYAGQRWVDSIREKAMIRILDQPREFFDREVNSVSRMTEGLDRNAEEMKNILGRFVGMILSAALMSIIAIAWSITGQWKFALICLSAGPYVYLVTNAFAVVSGRWETISTDAAEASSTIMNETFTNIRTVMALTLEDHFLKKYTVATDYALKVGYIRAILSGFFYGLSESAGTFSTALIFYVGTTIARTSGPSVVPGVLQVTALLVFTIDSVSALLSYVPQIGQAKDTASRLLRLAQLPKDSHEHMGNTKLNTIGEISFNNLNFSYPSRPDVLTLKDINLHIKPGTSTAIVGGSGCGKSTLLRLLGGLDRPDRGEVLFDGQAVREPHKDIGMVFQEPRLMPWLTNTGNVEFGLSDLPRGLRRERAAAALRRVRLDEVGDRCGAIAFDDRIRAAIAPRRRGGAVVVRALHDLEPRLVDADHEAAFRRVEGAKRAFVLILSDLLEPVAALLPLGGSRHAGSDGRREPRERRGRRSPPGRATPRR